MSETQKSEVQNVTQATPAAEPLDAAPPARDTGHVAQGEPHDYDPDRASDAADRLGASGDDALGTTRDG